MTSCCTNNIELDELLARWDLRSEAIPYVELKEELGRLTFRREDVEEHIRFDDSRYQRISIHRTPCYEVLVLCWRSGQRSMIHDHAGSACVIRILEGSATETVFEPSPCGRLVPTHSHSAKEGAMCASFDADIHQLANLQPAGRDLITFHVYSPPLSHMRTYSIEETALAPLDAAIASRPDRLLGTDLSPIPLGHLEPVLFQGS